MNFNFLDVPKYYFITDGRNPKNLKGLTLSNFRKIDVLLALESAILNNDLENSCKWTVELHISGLVENFWDTIFNIACRLINVMNVNVYLWIWNRFLKYRRIYWMVQSKYHYELRNNQEMRNLLIEIVSIITLSKKNKLLLNPPPIFETDFNQQIIKEHSVAEDYIEINNFTKQNEDAPEVIIAANEILNVIKFNMNTSAIYWYYWLDKLEQLKKKNKQNLNCLSRKISQVSEKYWTDWVWIIWNILLAHCQKIGRIEKHIKTLYQMYKHNFNTTTRKDKHPILCTAILLIKYDMNDQLDWKTPVIRHYHLYLQAVGNVNTLYQTIYNNLSEHIGDSEYIYMELMKQNIGSGEFKKYWNKLKKDLTKEGQDSQLKGSVFTNIISYKDKEKQNNILTTDQFNNNKVELIPDITYNLIKKNKPSSYSPDSKPIPIKEKNILEYYQHPTAKVLPVIQTYSSNISAKELSKYHNELSKYDNEKELAKYNKPHENKPHEIIHFDQTLDEENDNSTSKIINTVSNERKSKIYNKKNNKNNKNIQETVDENLNNDKMLISQLNFIPRKKFEDNEINNLGHINNNDIYNDDFKEILI
jgi:hypothetical protein